MHPQGTYRNLSTHLPQNYGHPVHMGGLTAWDTRGSFLHTPKSPPCPQVTGLGGSLGLFEVERAGRQVLSAPAGLLRSCHPCQLVRLRLSSTLSSATRELLSRASKLQNLMYFCKQCHKFPGSSSGVVRGYLSS